MNRTKYASEDRKATFRRGYSDSFCSRRKLREVFSKVCQLGFGGMFIFINYAPTRFYGIKKFSFKKH